MLTYMKSDSLEVVGYVDTDLAGCVDSRRSTSGYVFTLAGVTISWKSCKQSIATASTMLADFLV